MTIATLPAKLLDPLDLHEGDQVEGIVHNGEVTLHVAKRRISVVGERVQAVGDFILTWSGMFSLDGTPDDTRLDYLTQKHLR